MNKKVFIIAEAGDNHNGNIELAYRLVDVAKEAGADCVKFQTFITEEVVSVYAEKAEYQKQNTDSNDNQYEMIKKLELSFEDFKKIKKYCDDKEILFLSTAFDIPSIEFLEELDMPIWKIPSGEITNLPYLLRIAKTHKDIILSTGMADMDEIKEAVDVLKKNGAGEITILHCTTEYPAPFDEINLNAMDEIRNEFKCNVGYSDHTLGILVPVAAVAKGAKVIEKHFTLDKDMEGPDHKASLEPAELKEMIGSIRTIELVLGDGEKKPSDTEIKNKEIARKSIVARVDIRKGDIFTEKNLAAKRPGNGISPMKWYDILGKKAARDFRKDELIEI